MKYAKITAGKIEQIQPNYEEANGCVHEVPGDAAYGQIEDGQGGWKNPPADLASIKERLLIQLMQKIDREINTILPPYPEHEKLAFGVKKEMAEKLKATTITHTESGIIYAEAKRKHETETPSDAQCQAIADRIILKSTAYMDLIGRATDVREQYEAIINDAGTDLLYYQLPETLLS